MRRRRFAYVVGKLLLVSLLRRARVRSDGPPAPMTLLPFPAPRDGLRVQLVAPG